MKVDLSTIVKHIQEYNEGECLSPGEKLILSCNDDGTAYRITVRLDTEETLKGRLINDEDC